MDATLDKTPTETIDLLEARLQRIEYVVTGGQLKNSIASGTSIEVPAAKRLADLEHKLHQLASKSRVIQDLLRLYARHPDLFQSVGHQDLPTTLNPSDILSIVLASASSYPSTASRLTSISDVSIPAAEMSAQLIDLQPRIAKLETLQTAQNSDIAELRQRSAAVLQRWYSVDILSTGDSWAELEGRVETAEQRIRRVALAKRKDDDMI